MKYILSPCGTSLLTNQADPNERKLVFQYANKKTSDLITDDDRKKLIALISKVSELLKKADCEQAAKMSAELNGIIKIYDNQINNSGADFHFLLSTDTWLGEETANLVKSWLDNHHLTVVIHRQTDLQTAELDTFQISLSDLIKKLSEEIPEYSKKGYKIVFNLTGGFKSVQGFLQSIANFYADETVYIFESSSKLLKIPKIPVRMDIQAILKNKLSLFRQLSLGIEVDADMMSEIPKTLLFTIEDQTILSPWGELLWEQSKIELYKNELLPSPIDKIKYSKGFERDIVGLEEDRILLVNKRIDQLVKYMQEKANSKSLDFKKLRGNSMLPSTHEIDAWSDKDAKRIFGHYENNIFILDKLDKGLH
jgi:putative CRISPR-associated protein (TIGR02619 family)